MNITASEGRPGMGSVITSRLPGRLRLRSRELRRVSHNEAICRHFRDWDGVESVDGNPTTGGILLRYDVGRLSQEAMEARVLECLEAKPEIPVKKEAGQVLWQMNRYAKLGMLGSLTGTLLALLAGKKLHAAFGAMHLVFLMVHIANHRKKLLQ